MKDNLKHARLNGRTWLACGMSAALLAFAAPAMATEAGSDALAAAQQVSNARTVSGTVVDETGEPMIGVSVLVTGTREGVATDFDGNFSLKVPAGATLSFSYVGYKPQTVKVGDQSTINVTMEPDANVLDEVVAIGYGTIKKRDLTGAVSSVDNQTITITPTSNPLDALQGRVAGLDVSTSSGAPGSSPSVQLRGVRSITASGSPLYIIDGMPGDQNTINPNDIESIEVLKDASSTAVYGSSGANGVIIITTKKGKAGNARVNFDAYVGYNGWQTLPTMNNPQQWYDTKLEAARAAGIEQEVLQSTDMQTALKYVNDKSKWLNWPDIMLKGGVTQNYSLSVSGGT